MRMFFVSWLALVWLNIIGSSVHTLAQAAGRHGCCTAFSKVHAVKTIVKRGGAVRCRWQNITEGCSINAVVLTWKRRQVCVNPTPKKMKKLLETLCTGKPCKGKRNPGCPHGKKTKPT